MSFGGPPVTTTFYLPLFLRALTRNHVKLATEDLCFFPPALANFSSALEFLMQKKNPSAFLGNTLDSLSVSIFL